MFALAALYNLFGLIQVSCKLIAVCRCSSKAKGGIVPFFDPGGGTSLLREELGTSSPLYSLKILLIVARALGSSALRGGAESVSRISD